MIATREEQPADFDAIREVNRQAFGLGAAILSLVAVADGAVVVTMFSPVSVGPVLGAALGPMAVVPAINGAALAASVWLAVWNGFEAAVES